MVPIKAKKTLLRSFQAGACSGPGGGCQELSPGEERNESSPPSPELMLPSLKRARSYFTPRSHREVSWVSFQGSSVTRDKLGQPVDYSSPSATLQGRARMRPRTKQEYGPGKLPDLSIPSHLHPHVQLQKVMEEWNIQAHIFSSS